MTMFKRGCVVLLLISAAACGGSNPSPAAPSQRPATVSSPPVVHTPPPPPAPILVGDISVGDKVTDVIGDGTNNATPERDFGVTPARSGQLTISVSWDPNWTGTLLKVVVGDQTYGPVPPNWSPVLARVPVEAGRRYVIGVSVAGLDWFPKDQFELTTSLDP